MSYDYSRISDGLGPGLTPLGKKLLIIYSTIYILELLVEHWLNINLVSFLMLWPLNASDFHFWQILSHPFIHDPGAPISFLINCVVLYFFITPVEDAFGTKNFLILFYGSAALATVCGLLFSLVSGFNASFSGMMPSLLSIIVVFGLLNPEATILFMFILPIKAKYISYGTFVVTLLTFLAKANPHGAYHLGGILFGYIYLKGPKNVIYSNAFYQKYLEWQLKRKLSRFQVIDGQKKKRDKNRPTIH